VSEGGIKLHTLYDVKTSIPCLSMYPPASLHDMNTLDLLYYEPSGYYILDRENIDYERLFKIHKSSAYFVVRAKKESSVSKIVLQKSQQRQ
jgi:hypothetical protein